MAGAGISHRLVGLFQLLHQVFRFRDGRVDAVVESAIKAINGAVNLGQVVLILSEATVKDESSLEVLAIGGEAEGLAATPAETTNGKLAVAGWNLEGMVA